MIELITDLSEIETLYKWLVQRPENIFEDFGYKKCLYNSDALAPYGAYAVYNNQGVIEGLFPFWTWNGMLENFGGNWCMDQHIRATPEAADSFANYIRIKGIKYRFPYVFDNVEEMRKLAGTKVHISRPGYSEDSDDVRYGAFLDLSQYLSIEDYYNALSGKTRNTLRRQLKRMYVYHSWGVNFSFIIYEFEHSQSWVAERMSRKYSTGSYWKIEPKKRSFVKAMAWMGDQVHHMLVFSESKLVAVWLTSIDPYTKNMIYWYGATNGISNLGKYCYLEMIKKAFELKCPGINGLYGYYPIKQLFGFKPYGLYLVKL